jgi:hypothetical protein
VADQPLPCEFVEEDSGPEHGYRCTVCNGWFSRLVCDGLRITHRWWQPLEDCLAAATRDHD